MNDAMLKTAFMLGPDAGRFHPGDAIRAPQGMWDARVARAFFEPQGVPQRQLGMGMMGASPAMAGGANTAFAGNGVVPALMMQRRMGTGSD